MYVKIISMKEVKEIVNGEVKKKIGFIYNELDKLRNRVGDIEQILHNLTYTTQGDN